MPSAISSTWVRIGDNSVHVVMPVTLADHLRAHIGGTTHLAWRSRPVSWRECCELCPAAAARAGEQTPHVLFYGAGRHEQSPADLGVRQSLGNEFEHVHLTSSDTFRPQINRHVDVAPTPTRYR